MSRRKCTVAREKNGRPQRPARIDELMSPTETRRLLDAAQAGLRDPVFGSTLGRIYLTGKISATEFAAGKQWSELVASNSNACQSPKPPRTVPLDPEGGAPADPDSATGIREVRRHEKATANYLSGREALRRAGYQSERVVDDVVIQDRAPVGFTELESLRYGLQALSAWWNAKRRAAAR